MIVPITPTQNSHHCMDALNSAAKHLHHKKWHATLFDARSLSLSSFNPFPPSISWQRKESIITLKEDLTLTPLLKPANK